MNPLALQTLQVAALLIGLWLLLRGWRGRPDWSSPRCAVCRYDLHGLDPQTTTACPECGASLAGRRAVHFARFRRQPWIMAVGLAMIIGAAAWFVAGMPAFRQPPGPRSTATLLKDLDGPDPAKAWDRLYMAHHGQQRLTDEQVAVVADRAVKHMGQPTNAQGRPIQLMRCFHLLRSLTLESRLSQQQAAAIYEAMYAKALSAAAPLRVRQGGAARITIATPDTGRWNSLLVEPVSALRQVRCGDQVLLTYAQAAAASSTAGFQPRLSTGGRDMLTFDVPIPLECGSHELTFEIDQGLVKGESTRAWTPGAPDQWPPTLHRRRDELKATIEVVPADQSPIALRREPEVTDAVRSVIRLSGVHLRETDGGTRLSVVISTHRPPPVPLAFDVLVRIDGTEWRVATFTVNQHQREYTPLEAPATDVPASAATADVILRPNPALAETMAGIDAIQGEELIFSGVTLKRVDPGEPE